MDFQEAMDKRTEQYLAKHSDLASRPDGDAGYAFEDLCKFYLENGPWWLQKGRPCGDGGILGSST